MTTYTSWINDIILIDTLKKSIRDADPQEDTTLYEKTIKIMEREIYGK